MKIIYPRMVKGQKKLTVTLITIIFRITTDPTYIIYNEQIILQIVFAICYFLVPHILSPHRKCFPYPKFTESFDLDKDLIVPVLLLPASQCSVLRLVVPQTSHASGADRVVVVWVSVLVIHHLRQ